MGMFYQNNTGKAELSMYANKHRARDCGWSAIFIMNLCWLTHWKINAYFLMLACKLSFIRWIYLP